MTIFLIGANEWSFADLALRYRRMGYESLPFNYALNDEAQLLTLKYSTPSPLIPPDNRPGIAVLVRTFAYGKEWTLSKNQEAVILDLAKTHSAVVACNNFYWNGDNETTERTEREVDLPAA